MDSHRLLLAFWSDLGLNYFNAKIARSCVAHLLLKLLGDDHLGLYLDRGL